MRRAALLLLAAAAFLSGCTENSIIRDRVELCPEGSGDCGSYALENRRLTGAEGSYLIGYVEFDDQGQMHDRRQMDALFSQMEQAARTDDLCVIIFVHGWKHSARADDRNVGQFHALLDRVAKMELERGRQSGKAKKVVGIYAGWRGQSLEIGEPLVNVTFWSRKNAAHRVAEGSIRELFARTRHFVDDVNGTRPGGRTRLMTIGHSFGGLIVYAALSQYLLDNATTADPASESAGRRAVPGYGDLVLVINPAIEALRYKPIDEAIRARRFYPAHQKPVFIEITSTTDHATGQAFWYGRWFNTLLERYRDDEQRQQSRTAFGHYPPFFTHTLTKEDDDPTRSLYAVGGPLLDKECRDFAEFQKWWRKDDRLRAGWERRYTAGANLAHIPDSADPDVPYWIVKADPSVIDGHSDLEKNVFFDFVRQLYDDLVRSSEDPQCVG